MIPGRIEGANKTFVAPGCHDLLVRRDKYANGEVRLTSAWQPTVEELSRLNRGCNVHLSIVGEGLPPVLVTVGETDEANIHVEALRKLHDNIVRMANASRRIARKNPSHVDSVGMEKMADMYDSWAAILAVLLPKE